jgi:putative flippase GtrA
MTKRASCYQIFFFLFVGGITFLIDVSIAAIMYNTIHLTAFLASGIGFLSGFFFNFPMNRKRVFSAHTEYSKFSLHQQVVMYFALCLFNLVTTSYLVEILVNVQGNIVAAKTAATIMIAIWNFLLFKFYIFSNETKKIEEAETTTP